MKRMIESFKYRLANNYVYIAERLVAADRMECKDLRDIAIHFIVKAIKTYPSESDKYGSKEYMIPFINRYTKPGNQILKVQYLKES